MFFKFIRSSLIIIRDLIISPEEVFCSVTSKRFKKEIIFLFFLGAISPIFKSFNRESYSVNFWMDDKINHFLSLIGTPRITLIVAYLSFCLFLILLIIFCRIFLKNNNQKDLVFYLLSMNGLGVLVQILFYCFDLVLYRPLIFCLSYVAFIWIVTLSILAIKKGQNTGFLKAATIYFISAFPVYLIAGLPGLLPSFIWIA